MIKVPLSRIHSRVRSRIFSRIHSRTHSRIRSRTRSSRGTINSTTPRRSRTARRARLPQIITDSALQASRFPALQLSLTSFFSACPASWDLSCPLSDFVNAINVRKRTRPCNCGNCNRCSSDPSYDFRVCRSYSCV